MEDLFALKCMELEFDVHGGNSSAKTAWKVSILHLKCIKLEFKSMRIASVLDLKCMENICMENICIASSRT